MRAADGNFALLIVLLTVHKAIFTVCYAGHACLMCAQASSIKSGKGQSIGQSVVCKLEQLWEDQLSNP